LVLGKSSGILALRDIAQIFWVPWREPTFAEDMVRDHEAVNKQALALVKKLNVTPEDNDTSKTLTKNATEKRAELAKINGEAFDRAYVDNKAPITRLSTARSRRRLFHPRTMPI
jgi:predicted outer membrane protein